MAKELCNFHHRHGLNIRLLEHRRVALRHKSHNNGIVFTEQSIPNEYMFQVEVVRQIDMGYSESLRIGVTTQSPDEAEIPTDALEFFSKSDYWMLRNNQAYNSDSGVMLNFNINSLSVGQSVGLSVTPNGKLSFYVDGKFNNIVWRGLPTGMKYWGVADVYGSVLSIKSSFKFLPSMRRPNRARMLATRTCSDQLSLPKEYISPLSSSKPKECKFKVSDNVIIPTKDKEMVTCIVNGSGGGRLSQEVEVVMPSVEKDNETPLGHIEVKQFQLCYVEPIQTLKEQLALQEIVLQNTITEIKKENKLLNGLQQQLLNGKQQLELEKQKLLEENADLKSQLAQKTIENMQLKRQLNETSWKVSHSEITLTEEELGRGGWGAIKIGIFREQKVALKQMYQDIMSSKNLELIHREINTMATLRHPNILQFIGAVLDDPSGNPMIITEVMDTTLRNAYINRELTPDPSCQPTLLTIMRDVAAGLNYLHCLHDPIIHRDISSSNVLLEYKGHQKWKTKISDFGSANKARQAVTIAAGAFVYSAPESSKDIHKELTTKMDSYSYGILLCEVVTCRFPDSSVFKKMLIKILGMSHDIHELILSCTNNYPEARPSMKRIIERLDICMKQF